MDERAGHGQPANGEEAKKPDDPRIKQAAITHLRRLAGYETVVGGWNYYDFNAQTQTPSMGPTSFGASAGLVALYEARQSGLPVPQPMLDRTLKRLVDMKLPNQAYLYSFDLQYRPRMPANLPRGSVGRTQAGNFALWVWGKGGIDEKAARDGLDFFIKEHDYIQMGRKRQYPHESWYQTAPYYYYFGHYYAARLVEKLGDDGRRVYGPQSGRPRHPPLPGRRRQLVGLRNVGFPQTLWDGVRHHDAVAVWVTPHFPPNSRPRCRGNRTETATISSLAP